MEAEDFDEWRRKDKGEGETLQCWVEFLGIVVVAVNYFVCRLFSSADGHIGDYVTL